MGETKLADSCATRGRKACRRQEPEGAVFGNTERMVQARWRQDVHVGHGQVRDVVRRVRVDVFFGFGLVVCTS